MSDDRRGLVGAIWAVLRSPLAPGYKGTPTFGWLLVVLFVVQLFTGILLSMYYQASPALVNESVRHLMRDVSWGWLIRGIHFWAAHGMIVLCVLQLLRFLWNGAYRGAAAGHWVLGLLMTGLILTLVFGGSLLVWDEVAYWRMTRALEELEGIPLLGEPLALILRGGEEVTATSLSRAYSLHALLLPWTLALLLVLNLWFLGRRRDGNGS